MLYLQDLRKFLLKGVGVGVIDEFIHRGIYPITLMVLLVTIIVSLPFSRAPMLLRIIYLALVVLCLPYGCMVYLASITADLYDNPIQKLNLLLIVCINLSVQMVLISYLRQVKCIRFDSNLWLYCPFGFIAASVGCSSYLLFTQ